jgi:rubrerythrin
MSNQTASLGRNRSGIATSPNDSRQMMEGAAEFMSMELEADKQEISQVRQAYAQEGDPIGSVPPPREPKGIAKVLVKGITGSHPTQFLDKLGERCAFERTGARLYEALISKFHAYGGFEGGPELNQLEKIMTDEYNHFRMLSDVIVKLGADPTAITPSANVGATISKGITEIMVDPRTTFVQCLEAILIAELADNECWESLLELARENTKDGVVASFERVRVDEDEHLSSIRTWVAAAQNREIPAE